LYHKPYLAFLLANTNWYARFQLQYQIMITVCVTLPTFCVQMHSYSQLNATRLALNLKRRTKQNIAHNAVRYKHILHRKLIRELLSVLRGGIAHGVPCTATNTSPLFFPIWILIIPDSPTRALYGSNQQTHIVAKQEKLSKKGREFCLQATPSYSGILTCRKILRHGAAGFTSPSKEGVLRISITLKIYRPRPGLNLRTLGPVARTVSTRPPRATCHVVHNSSVIGCDDLCYSSNSQHYTV
jgi:hypothetical protein